MQEKNILMYFLTLPSMQQSFIKIGKRRSQRKQDKISHLFFISPRKLRGGCRLLESGYSGTHTVVVIQ